MSRPPLKKPTQHNEPLILVTHEFFPHRGGIAVYATEMAAEILDHAMQTFGAMGVTKELPLQLMAQRVRVMRVYEGPAEVHRMSIAKKILKDMR